MSGNQPTPEQVGGHCGEAAVPPPPPSRDLPAGRHQFHREHLMNLIDNENRTAATPVLPQRRTWLRRPAFTLPAVGFALAGVVGAVVLSLPHDDAGPRGGAPVSVEALQPAGPQAGTRTDVGQRLNQMALVAATRPDVTVKPGQFVYVAGKFTWMQVERNQDTGKTTIKPIASDRKKWEPADGKGGWLIATGVGDPAGGIPLEGDPPQFLTPSPLMLADLPTDPDELIKRIYAESKGRGTSPDSQAFTAVGDLLGESYPPAQLYSSLFKAAAKIPGVMVVEDAVDGAGRHGVAVARVDEVNGERTELIFDRKDYTYLGSRSVLVREKAGMKAGTVTFSSAILERAIVNKLKQVPGTN